MASSDSLPTSGEPKSPVPLDTIPISPTKENESPGDEEGNTTSQASGASQSPADGQVTVFHDPENFNVKHPLMHEWTLWFTKPPSSKGDNNWNDLLKEVVTFDSVEEFWGVYVLLPLPPTLSLDERACPTDIKTPCLKNNITPTSELALKSDYHLFKKGIRPEWEDPQNKHGGKWSYHFKDKRAVPIDELWLHVMLSAIGETLERDSTDGEVMGVVVNVRKGFYRIGLWTKTVGKSVPGGGDGDVAGGKGRSAEKSRDVLIGLGKKFKEVLRLKDSEPVEFSGHTESAQSGSTRAKAKFTV